MVVVAVEATRMEVKEEVAVVEEVEAAGAEVAIAIQATTNLKAVQRILVRLLDLHNN